MRKQLCDALIERSNLPNMTFLTGDLGFMALEDLRDALGQRFINAGVAEQNMISVAAAMAKQGLEVWVYSIAPFCYARPFEQIRNDICFHGLAVKIIGNGGGYGYGVMGPTHHAIEDYGVLLTLPNMRAYVPAFEEDVADVIHRLGESPDPAYLRLGRGEIPKNFQVPPYAAWRHLIAGNGPTIIAVGPIAGIYLQDFIKLPIEVRPNFWVACEMPLKHNPMPEILLRQVKQSSNLSVIEEHVSQGSFASAIAVDLLVKRILPNNFLQFCAQKHIYGGYGSQGFLRKESGLMPADVLSSIYPDANF
jgi:transketolase